MDISVLSEKIDDVLSVFCLEFTFGWRLRHIRNMRGLTQKQLGIICNFPDKAADIRIRQYESNKRHPKDDIISILSNSLKISPLMLTLQTTDIKTLLFATVLWADIANIVRVFDSTKMIEQDDDIISPIKICFDSNMPGIVPSGEGPLYDWLKELSNLRKQYVDGDISIEEYRDWHYLWVPSYKHS